MFKIRREQKEVFAAMSVDEFQRKVRIHLQACFPERCRQLGEAEMSNAVLRGMDRARALGLVSERDVCKYLSLVFACGEGFDGEAGVPGARAILAPKSISPEDRLEQLYQAALVHLRAPTAADAGEER
jgi:hypothetical protein